MQGALRAPCTRPACEHAIVDATLPLRAVDAYEFASLRDVLKVSDMTGNPIPDGDDYIVEHKPMFHEWATVQPGMICLARKKKTAVFRQYVAAETAVPVVACAACLPYALEKDYFFAGVARSKSVRSPDDGVGPTVDEFFTVSIGGMSTLLNTSGTQIHPGDLVEWCFISPKAIAGNQPQKRMKTGPRRVGIKVASVSSPKIIGRVRKHPASTHQHLNTSSPHHLITSPPHHLTTSTLTLTMRWVCRRSPSPKAAKRAAPPRGIPLYTPYLPCPLIFLL